MRKIYLLFCSLVALSFIGGCDIDPQNLPALQNGIVIRLSCTDIQTKGTEAGTGRENYVGVLDILVYESEESSAPFVTHRISNVSDPLAGTYEQDLTSDFAGNIDKVKNAIIFVVANYPGTLPTDQSLATVKALALDENTTATFLSRSGAGTDADPYKYKVAEKPVFVMTAEGAFKQGTGSDSDKAVADLKLNRVAAKITLQIGFPDNIQTSGTDNFFGTGVAPTTTTWTPMTSGRNVRVYLVNGRANALLGGASATPVYPAAPSSFTYDENIMTGSVSNPFYTYPMNLESVQGGGSEPYIKLILPWRYTTTIEQDGKAVIIDQNIVELYYKIMLPNDLTELDANTLYKLSASISVLGGEANRPTTIVADGLRILPWNTVGSNNLGVVSYTETHFVVLPVDGVRIEQPNTSENKYQVTVEKGEKFSFRFFATEEVEMTVKKIQFTRLTNGDRTNPGVDDGPVPMTLVTDDVLNTSLFETNQPLEGKTSWTDSETGVLSWVSMQNNEKKTGGTVSLNHEMTVDYLDQDFAVTPYTYVLELSLKDHPTVIAEVTITQTPKIYIQQQLSAAKVFINGTSNAGTGSYRYTGVFANNNIYLYNGTPHEFSSNDYTNPQIHSNSYTSLGALPKPSYALGGTVASKYRYMLEVAPFNNEVLITNPLDDISTGTDLGNILTKSGTNGTTGTLPITNDKYRYNSGDVIVVVSGNSASQRNSSGNVLSIKYKAPALALIDGSNDRARDFMAPKFIIASSFGLSGSVLAFGQAFLRCATYQEDGYPAGRWRLPTEAEIKYLYQLSQVGVLPLLLNGNYWASSGRLYRYSTNDFSGSSGSVYGNARCVYDAWYWGDSPKLTPDGSGNYTYTVGVTK